MYRFPPSLFTAVKLSQRLQMMCCLCLLCGSANAAVDLGIPRDYNAFIEEDFTAYSTDIQGKLAVGGNVSLVNYGIAAEYSMPANEYSLIAGGDIHYDSGQIFFGSVIAGGDVSDVAWDVRNALQAGATLHGDAGVPIDFESEFSRLRRLSSELAALPQNGAVELKWGGLHFNGDCQSETQIFQVSGSTLLTASYVSLNCIPTASTILVNVTGDVGGFQSIGLSPFAPYATTTVFNFPEATQIDVSWVGIEGSILAPNAHFDNPLGSVNGTVIGKSWNGQMELHHVPFAGMFEGVSLSVDPDLVNTTPSIHPIDDIDISETETYTVVIEAENAGGVALSYSLQNAPDFVQLEGNTLTVSPDYNSAGHYGPITVFVPGGADDISRTFNLQISNVNREPIVTLVEYISLSEGDSAEIAVSASDPDGDDVTLSYENLPAYASTTNAGNILLKPTYQDAGFYESVTVIASDGQLQTSKQVSITVSDVARAPVITSSPITTVAENSMYAYQVNALFDGDEETIVFELEASSEMIAIDSSTGLVTWQTTADDIGSYDILVRVKSGAGLSDEQNYVLTVTNVNDAPTAPARSLVLNEDETIQFQLTGNDVDDNVLSVDVVSEPSHGSLVANPAGFLYTPDADYYGEDSFLYRVSDAEYSSDNGVVGIEVRAINDAPEFSNSPLTTLSEGEAYRYIIFATDTEGDTISYELVSAPSGMEIDKQTGVISWLTDYEDAGNYSILVSASDGELSNQLTYTLQVSNVNRAPKLLGEPILTIDEGQVYQFDVDAIDDDGDELIYRLSSAPIGMSINASTGEIEWLPSQTDIGDHTLEIVVSDNEGLSDSQSYILSVINVNNAPFVSDETVSTSEDSAVNITLKGTDVDGDALSFKVISETLNGQLTGVPPNLVYTPNADFNGGDRFIYHANDGGLSSSVATISISVAAVNDAPVAQDFSVTMQEDTAVATQLIASDLEGESLSYEIITQPQFGAVSGAAPSLTYTPNENYFGEDTFSYRVNDGEFNSTTATVTISIASSNDMPVANALDISTDEDTSVVILLSGDDVEGSPLNFIVGSQPINGGLVGTPPNLTYTPNENYFGADEFTFYAADGENNSSIAIVSIEVSAVNDGPKITSSPVLSLAENEEYIYVVSATDVENEPLNYSLMLAPAGMEIDEVGGEVRWQTDFSSAGDYDVVVSASDGVIATEQSFILTVTDSSRAPEFTSSPIAFVVAGDTWTYSLAATDADGDALTFAILQAPVNAVYDSATQTISWATASLGAENNSFHVSVTDEGGLTEEQKFSVEILAAERTNTHEGTEFWVPVSINAVTISEEGTFDINLVSNGIDTTATIDIPALGLVENLSLSANEMSTFSINLDEFSAAGGFTLNEILENYAVHITSGSPIAVYLINQKGSTTDGFLGLPASSLGKEYIAATYIMLGKLGISKTVDGGQLGAMVTIVATEDNTQVTIDPIMDILPGDQRQIEVGNPIELTMSSGDVYNLETKGSFKADLTGSMIRADKPISVIGQMECVNVPVGQTACDHLVEQLPPIESLATDYYSVPFWGRTKYGRFVSQEYGDTFRVVAPYDDTGIYIDEVLRARLQKGEYYEFFANTPQHVSASHPVLMVQYSNGNQFDEGYRELENDFTDPFMVVVPPAEQFLSQYTINTPSRDLAYNFVNLLVPTNTVSTITIDGQPIDVTLFAEIPNSQFSYAQLPISTGSHHLAAQDPFGVYVYGYDYFESYGYLGGMALSASESVAELLLQGEVTQSLDNQWCAEASLLDDLGRPVNGVQVKFNVAGVTIRDGYKFSDAHGVARYCYRADKPGTDLVTASVKDFNQFVNIDWIAGIENQAPVIKSLPILRAVDGDSYSYDVLAEDPEGESLTYTLIEAPSGMSIDDLGQLNWSDVNLSAGTYNRVRVTLSVSDPHGGVILQSFELSEYAVFNTPPQFEETEVGLTATLGIPYAYNLNQPDHSLSYLKYQILVDDEDEDAVFVDILSGPEEAYIQRIIAYYTRITRENDPRSCEGCMHYFRWTPQAVGEQTFELGLRDARGGKNESQIFTVNVLPNISPEIIDFSPPSTASVGDAYYYVIDVLNDIPLDHNENRDNLRIIFEDVPVRMINTLAMVGSLESKLAIRWIPIASDVGFHPVKFRIADQLNVSELYEFSIEVLADNNAPEIQTSSLGDAESTIPFQYTVSATDPDGDAISFSLAVAPEGMTIDETTGVINWLPGSITSSYYEFIWVAVEDSFGLVSVKQFYIHVAVFNNRAPTFIPAYLPKFAKVGQEFVYQATATDREGDIPIAYTLRSSASGPVINAQDGTITWTPTAEGSFWLSVKASDSLGNYSSSNAEFWYVEVLPSNAELDATIEISPSTIIELDDTVTLSVIPENEASSVQVTMVIDGNPVTVDDLLQAQFIPARVGRIPVAATISDGYESITRTATIVVRDPADITPPIVEINSPTNTSDITAPTEIFGTVQDEGLSSVLLAYKPANDPIPAVLNLDDFTILYEGTDTFDNQAIANIDTTMLLNGTYHILLYAMDANNNSNAAIVAVNVTGDLKVGNFSITLADINIPMSGLPLSISRAYDSRRKSEDLDFGYGWSLDYQNIRLQESDEPTKGWTQTVGRGTFIVGGAPITTSAVCIDPSYDKTVSITLPNGDVEKFSVALKPSNGSSASISNPNCYLASDRFYDVYFLPTDGTQSLLSAASSEATSLYLTDLDRGYLSIAGDSVASLVTNYILTTRAGYIYTINQDNGVQKIEDPAGHSITFSDEGIIHSLGDSITFNRDDNGHITSITKPNGDALNYQYDVGNNLVGMSDELEVNHTYTYNAEHVLLEMLDPLGRRLVRNIYNDEGRLIAQEDSEGNRTDFNHNLEGRESIVTDRLGRTTVFYYDDKGNVTSQVDALGNVTTWVFDENGNELSKTDTLGRTTRGTYSEADDQLTATDALGNTTTFTYNDKGQELTIVDAMDNMFTNTYDTYRNLRSITDPLDNTATVSILDGTTNFVGTVTDVLGNTTRYTYYRQGWKGSEHDAFNNITSYAYDDNGNQTRETRSRTLGDNTVVEEMSSSVYDKRGRAISTTDALGVTSKMEYDIAGNQIASIDAQGLRTEMDYDLYGRLIETRYPDGTSSNSGYDLEGNLLSSTDRNGNITTFEYDALNRKTAVVYANGDHEQTEYDAEGNITAQIDSLNNRTEFEYDAAGRRTITRDALGNEHTFEYDANGNLTAEVDANNHRTEYRYNALDQRTSTTFSNASTSGQMLDAMGRRTAQIDQANVSTQYAYDALGRLLSVTDAEGNITQYTYDEVGNKLTQTNAENKTTTWTYDALGRVLSRTLPMGQSENLVYNNLGNMTERTDFNRDTTTYSYDNVNRVTQMVFADGNQQSFGYDNNGNKTQATQTDPLGNVHITSYEYDVLNRLVREVQPTGHELQYLYDAAGNKIVMQVRLPDLVTIERTDYGYDALNRLVTVSKDGQITSYDYDNVGNRASVSYPNGTSEIYIYDSLNRLTKKETFNSEGALLQSFDYTLHATGRRTKIDELNGRLTEYTYDSLYRLTNENITDAKNGSYSAEYQYDTVGNRSYETVDGVQTAYTYDDNDRLIQSGGTTYSYDANGNTLSESLDGETTTYIYDSLNKLVEVEKGTTITIYRYNVNGIRTQKDDGAIATDYVVDSNRDYAQVVLEDNSVESISYIYGDDLVAQERSGAIRYFHYDGLGSTRALSDSTGAITDTYDYEAFGETLNRTGETENNYLFTGEQFDPNLDQYYLRARYYDQGVGRFTSMDTFGGIPDSPLSLNKYLYAHSDPVLNTDPSGLFISSFSVSSIMGTLATLATPQVLRMGAVAAGRGATTAVQAGVVYCLGQMVSSLIGSELETSDSGRAGCEMNRMRVQLQQGHAHTNSKVAVALPSYGVSVNHVRAKLNHLYYGRRDGNWFPSDLDRWMYQSIVSMSIQLGSVPASGGVRTVGRDIMRRETFHRNKEYRIDIENLRGHNLRF